MASLDAKDELRKLRLGVDLRSVSGFSQNVNVYCRYSHPLLGSAPFLTLPAVAVGRGMESVLDNGFCSFELVSSLANVASQPPLVITLYHKDSHHQRDLGSVTVPFQAVIDAPIRTGPSGGIRFLDKLFAVQSAEGSQVATLAARFTLEDFGPAPAAAPGPNLASSGAVDLGSSQGSVAQGKLDSTVDREKAARDREYAVAWELEMWRRAEEERCKAQWKEMEITRMAELEAQWRRHEMARAAQFAEQERELGVLERKLKVALFEVEKKERQLRLTEEELKRRAHSISHDREEHKKETANTLQRMRDQYAHQHTLNGKMAADLRKHNDLIKSQIASTEARHRALEEEFRKYKIAHDKSNTGQLRIELQSKDEELKRLRNELTESRAEEDRARGRLIDSLREIQRLKRAREQAEQERLQLERLDLAKLRSQYVADQHRVAAGHDREQLAAIRDDIHALMAEERRPRTAHLAIDSKRVPSMAFSHGPRSPKRGLSHPSSPTHSRMGSPKHGKPPLKLNSPKSRPKSPAAPSHHSRSPARPAGAANSRPASASKGGAAGAGRSPAKSVRARPQSASSTKRMLFVDDDALDSERSKLSLPIPTLPESAAQQRLMNEQLRLEMEREDLVRSGVYQPTDSIIVELDRRIEDVKRAAASAGSSY